MTLNINIWIYIILINITGFSVMGIDKKKAVRHAYRISERTLFYVALMGGSPGSIIGMYSFRHKTRHWSFVIGMPLILAVQMGLVIYLVKLNII